MIYMKPNLDYQKGYKNKIQAYSKKWTEKLAVHLYFSPTFWYT